MQVDGLPGATMGCVELSGTIAANARAERARRQLRQDDVAAAAGISRTRLSVIESGDRRITIEDIIDLCRGLHVGLRDLLAGGDPKLVELLQLDQEG
jgi:transcriptional regulator with XRE-family HTH domain